MCVCVHAYLTRAPMKLIKWKDTLNLGLQVQGPIRGTHSHKARLLILFFLSPGLLLLTQWLSQNGVLWTLGMWSLTFSMGSFCNKQLRLRYQFFCHKPYTDFVTDKCSPRPQETEDYVPYFTSVKHKYTSTQLTQTCQSFIYMSYTVGCFGFWLLKNIYQKSCNKTEN